MTGNSGVKAESKLRDDVSVPSFGTKEIKKDGVDVSDPAYGDRDHTRMPSNSGVGYPRQ
jgi:hypothetical protein